MDEVFALYVEKELVGKRVKGSKVKITWKFAYRSELKTHEVELKHSLMSGKREIKLDSKSIFSSKKFLSGPFEHPFSLPGSNGGKPLSVRIEEGRDGYAYDLLINGKLFQRHTRISIMDFEDLRKSVKRERAQADTSDVKEIGYGDFVRKDPSNLDGARKYNSEKNVRKASDEDIFGWTKLTENPVATPSPTNPNFNSTYSPFDEGPAVHAKPHDTSDLFNPFESNAAGQTNPQTPPFDPFASPITVQKPSPLDHDNQFYNAGSQYQRVEYRKSAPAGFQALDQTYSESLNSVTAGLDSLDFSGNYTSQPINTSYGNPQPASTSSSFQFSSSNGNNGSSQQNNPIDSLVNLDSIKSTASTQPLPQNTFTAYRFQYQNRNGGNRTYSQTVIAPQHPNGHIAGASMQNYTQPGVPFQQSLQPGPATLPQQQQYQQSYQHQPYQQHQYQQQQYHQQENPFSKRQTPHPLSVPEKIADGDKKVQHQYLRS